MWYWRYTVVTWCEEQRLRLKATGQELGDAPNAVQLRRAPWPRGLTVTVVNMHRRSSMQIYKRATACGKAMVGLPTELSVLGPRLYSQLTDAERRPSLWDRKNTLNYWDQTWNVYLSVLFLQVITLTVTLHFEANMERSSNLQVSLKESRGKIRDNHMSWSNIRLTILTTKPQGSYFLFVTKTRQLLAYFLHVYWLACLSSVDLQGSESWGALKSNGCL